MAKGKKTVINRTAYTMAITDGKHAEMTLYGDIVEARPVDWWTGEEVAGDFIIQSEFLSDLETIKDCDDLTIHLNSCGGDAFVAIAIHNRLRELPAVKTCIVDGAAMSGGSLIMCACDTVKVNPSSIILIHDCWSYAFDRFNSTKLRKLADDLDVINESQAEIYARKTGMEAENIRELMAKETMITGRKAVEFGLADEVIEDADDADVSISADHHTLYACGRKMRFAAMGELPDGIKVVETEPETDGGDNTPEASGKNGGKGTMTWEEFRKENPEAAEAAIAEAQASVSHAEAEEAARASERARCEEIDGLRGVFDDATIQAAKYGENPCTAQEMAFRAAQEMAKQGRTFLNQLQADYKESGADAVGAAPAAEEDDKPMTADDMRAAGAAMAKKLRGEKTEEV